MQFYPNFALFSTMGGMNLDHHFFQMSKLSEEQKKRSSPKMEHFFSPNSGEDQKKVFTKNGTRRVARNLQWGGANFWVWGWSLQPPKANGGLGAKPADNRGLGAKGLRPEPPALENFACFCKNSLILGLF